MAAKNCSDISVDTREVDDGRLSHRLLSSVDWKCDLAGIGPETAVRWVLHRDMKAIAWLNLREVENGPWVLATWSETKDFEQKLLHEFPEFLEYDERPGLTTGPVFPAWVHTIHFHRDDDRWEFVQ